MNMSRFIYTKYTNPNPNPEMPWPLQYTFIQEENMPERMLEWKEMDTLFLANCK